MLDMTPTINGTVDAKSEPADLIIDRKVIGTYLNALAIAREASGEDNSFFSDLSEAIISKFNPNIDIASSLIAYVENTDNLQKLEDALGALPRERKEKELELLKVFVDKAAHLGAQYVNSNVFDQVAGGLVSYHERFSSPEALEILESIWLNRRALGLDENAKKVLYLEFFMRCEKMGLPFLVANIDCFCDIKKPGPDDFESDILIFEDEIEDFKPDSFAFLNPELKRFFIKHASSFKHLVLTELNQGCDDIKIDLYAEVFRAFNREAASHSLKYKSLSPEDSIALKQNTIKLLRRVSPDPEFISSTFLEILQSELAELHNTAKAATTIGKDRLIDRLTKPFRPFMASKSDALASNKDSQQGNLLIIKTVLTEAIHHAEESRGEISLAKVKDFHNLLYKLMQSGPNENIKQLAGEVISSWIRSRKMDLRIHLELIRTDLCSHSVQANEDSLREATTALNSLGKIFIQGKPSKSLVQEAYDVSEFVQKTKLLDGFTENRFDNSPLYESILDLALELKKIIKASSSLSVKTSFRKSPIFTLLDNSENSPVKGELVPMAFDRSFGMESINYDELRQSLENMPADLIALEIAYETSAACADRTGVYAKKISNVISSVLPELMQNESTAVATLSFIKETNNLELAQRVFFDLIEQKYSPYLETKIRELFTELYQQNGFEVIDVDDYLGEDIIDEIA